jgi:cytoskeletal protein CcmA (bactofilin family)
MFKGEKNKGVVESPERLNRLVSGTKLKGDLITESNLRLDGTILGSISCQGKFVLGESGKLEGNLVSLEAEIEGTIQGDLVVDGLLLLRKSANIIGSVQTGRLVIEDGAQIKGNITTGDLPKVAPKPISKPIEKAESPKMEREPDVVY